MKRIIITVVGHDQVGITAKITAVLADTNVNILDINQTLLQDIFTMVMLCDITAANVAFDVLQEKLDAVGEELGMKILAQKEEIFTYMHRI
ncbi:MAG TPA: ACT domain-containing protein [Clostridiales bacterium]|nr:ACT domain-containing protein [Clostridiales bacterium]